MHKRFDQFQNHRKRSKQIIFLFVLDILFLIISLIAAIVQTAYSQAIIIVCLSLDFLSIIHTASYSVRNLILVNNLENYFFHKNYGTSSIKIETFHKLLDENLFYYNFQPIVNAKTGEVFGYEALMRTNPDSIGMLPMEVMDLASKEGRLYDIEKLTINNTLKMVKEYSDIFSTKKLFINSISSHQLSESDFACSMKEYSEVFSRIVIEVTEATNISESNLLLLNRYQEAGCQLALDNYGTGYSSKMSIASVHPHYAKLDRSLLRFINIDAKKQNLVAEFISLAKKNNVKVIAQGIENYEELEYAIQLGADYVQGFYTARPDTLMTNYIAEDVTQKIQRINYQLFCENSTKLIYETKGEKILYPSEISTDLYYSILIYEEEITLKGVPGDIADLSLVIPDNMNCTITFDHVSLRNSERPSIVLSNNSSLTLKLVGDNYIMNDGIRVPESAQLTITGDGNLTLHSDRSNRVAIGGTDAQTYGNITLSSTGNIHIISGGNITVGIGGGQNSNNSIIRLLSGNIQIESTGYNAICAGSILGNARIEIGADCHLRTKTEGTKAVGIGSIVGPVYLNISGNLNINCDGRSSVCVGALEDAEGSISFKGGISNLKFNTHHGVGVGAIDGKLNIEITEGDILIHGEGTEAVGLGDHAGNSHIRVSGGVLAIQMSATNQVLAGIRNQNIIIDGGNIQCDFPVNIIPVNSYGVPLTSHIITNTDEFIYPVETVTHSYEYRALYSARYPFIKVYLPEHSSIN